jgi:hypothetical protein
MLLRHLCGQIVYVFLADEGLGDGLRDAWLYGPGRTGREKQSIESSALVALGLVFFCLFQQLIVLPDVSVLSVRVQF